MQQYWVTGKCTIRGIPRIKGETVTLSPEEAEPFRERLKPTKRQAAPTTKHTTTTATQQPTPSGKRSRFDAWGLPSASGNWLGRGPDSEIRGDLQKSRDRAIDVSLDDRFAKRVVEVLDKNVIGKGIRLQAKVEKERGEGLDTRVNSLIEEAWEEWLDKQFCHTAGLQHFYDLQKTAFISCIMTGESFVHFVREPFGGSKIPLSLELLESAQCPVEDYTKITNSGRQMRMGVEVDSWLRPVSYYFYNYHPGEYWSGWDRKTAGYRRHLAEDILHLYALRRPNQHRGLSWLRATQEPLKHLAGFNEAYLYAARVGACVAGMLQSAYPDTMPLEEEAEAEEPYGLRPIGKLEPGTIYQLPQGETFQGFDPKRPESAYEPFVRAQLRGIAAGSNTTYEELSSDYSQANYSSIRQSHVISIYYWQVLQDWFCREWLDPIYKEFLNAFWLSDPTLMAAYSRNQKRFTSPKARRWVCRGWSWVDPLKEVSAIEKSLALGLTSLTEEASKQGRDFEDVVKSRAREIKVMQAIAQAENIPLEWLMQSAGQAINTPPIEENEQ